MSVVRSSSLVFARIWIWIDWRRIFWCEEKINQSGNFEFFFLDFLFLFVYLFRMIFFIFSDLRLKYLLFIICNFCYFSLTNLNIYHNLFFSLPKLKCSLLFTLLYLLLLLYLLSFPFCFIPFHVLSDLILSYLLLFYFILFHFIV